MSLSQLLRPIDNNHFWGHKIAQFDLKLNFYIHVDYSEFFCHIRILGGSIAPDWSDINLLNCFFCMIFELLVDVVFFPKI